MIMCILGFVIDKFKHIINYCLRKYYASLFSYIGKDVYIGNNGIFTYSNIEIGDDVFIGANAVFQSSYGKIKIGSHIMFGPGVNIHGGNHKIHELGKYMKHASPKLPGDDGEIIIEDDCWIGANAVILSNVRIGKGSVIGGGASLLKTYLPIPSILAFQH